MNLEDQGQSNTDSIMIELGDTTRREETQL